MRPVGEQPVTQALARAGTDNPLLGIGTGTGRPAGHLCAPAVAGTPPARELVDAVASWLGHPERRVAASLVVLGYAARLVGPTLAVVLRDGILLDARPDRVQYEYAPHRGFTLHVPHPVGWHGRHDVLLDTWCRTIIDDHLGRLIQAVRRDTPVAAGLLWGNVASGIVGTLQALANDPAVLDRCRNTGLTILQHGPLRGSGPLTTTPDGRLQLRRRSCCLYYRLPGGGTCGDCPL
jgi:ferric iron reductase protein FhuF